MEFQMRNQKQHDTALSLRPFQSTKDGRRKDVEEAPRRRVDTEKRRWTAGCSIKVTAGKQTKNQAEQRG